MSFVGDGALRHPRRTAGPLQALTTEIVSDAERGALMSLSMAVGQSGAGIGGAIAGAAYGRYGYASSAVLAAASALAVGFGRLALSPRAGGDGR